MDYFHVSRVDLGKKVVLTPKIPESAVGESNRKRVCFAPSIWQCLWSLYSGKDIHINDILLEWLPYFGRSIKKPWRGRDTNLKGDILVLNPVVYVPTKPTKLVRPPQHLSDFAFTGERWSLSPIEVKRIGYVDLHKLLYRTSSLSKLPLCKESDFKVPKKDLHLFNAFNRFNHRLDKIE